MRKSILIILALIPIILLLSCATMVMSDPYYDPDAFSVPRDGQADSTSAWEYMLSSIPPGSTIILPPDCAYLIDSSGGLTINKQVHIIGAGKGSQFISGSSIGNAPTLTFTSNGCILEGFLVNCRANHTDGNDDDFQDVADSLESNLRGGVLLSGASSSTCSKIIIDNSLAGIRLVTSDDCVIDNCGLTNTIITSGTPGAHNYNCGVYIQNSDSVTISSSYNSGHGQGVLISESYGTKVYSNKISGSSNNGVYSSSGSDSDIHDNEISNFDSSGVKSRGVGSNIHHNRILCNVSGGCISGITLTGNGENGSDGFNGHGMQANYNIITGNANAGILVGVQDGGYLADPQITFNTIRFDSDATRACYGIQFASTSSLGAMIIGNQATNHSFGLIMSVASGRWHDDTMIALNVFIGGSNDAFSLNGLRNPVIANNIGKNCGTGRSGLMLYNSSSAHAEGNAFGDTQDSPTQKYGIEEGGGASGNMYIYNITAGVVSLEYRNINPDSSFIVYANPDGGD